MRYNSPKYKNSPNQYGTASPIVYSASSATTEPLYCTVTTNPLDEYSSGYHGSGSLYMDSSASSTGSTAVVQPAGGSTTASPRLMPSQSPPMLGRNGGLMVTGHGGSTLCNIESNYSNIIYLFILDYNLCICLI